MAKKGRIVVLKEQQDAILGLDCSSATIGWGLISLDFNLLAYGHIKPLKSDFDLIERLNDTYNQISFLCDKFKPKHIAIEDVITYMKGNSQAKTISILIAFNRISALAGFRKTKDIKFYSVHEIRKLIKVHYNFNNKIGKEDMPEIIQKNLLKDFEYIINRKGNVAKETMDEADGIAAALAYVIELNRGINERSL
jgi:Holliday junction resolvasome RuvABC endonuclease subunit